MIIIQKPPDFQEVFFVIYSSSFNKLLNFIFFIFRTVFMSKKKLFSPTIFSNLNSIGYDDQIQTKKKATIVE